MIPEPLKRCRTPFEDEPAPVNACYQPISLPKGKRLAKGGRNNDPSLTTDPHLNLLPFQCHTRIQFGLLQAGTPHLHVRAVSGFVGLAGRFPCAGFASARESTCQPNESAHRSRYVATWQPTMDVYSLLNHVTLVWV